MFWEDNKMSIMRYGFLNIISLVLISVIADISYAEDLEIQNIEQALGIKTTTSCTEPPCPVDADSLLEKLLSEHAKKRDDAQSNDIEEAAIEENIVEEKKDDSLVRMDRAELIILNKITAKSQKVIFNLGEVKFFGNISIEVHKCIKSTDPFNANNLMLLTVFDNKIEDENLSIFHGWVFSSNPSLSTMEHPVYEALPMRCLAEEE